MRFSKSVVIAAAVGVAGGLTAASAALAGSNNKIYVKQDRTFGETGNMLRVDQTDADDSLVRGLNDSLSSLADPAVQKGSGNAATLTIQGSGGTIQLLQDNADSGGAGNTATANVIGHGLGVVSQIGSKNLATLTVNGGALTDSLTKGRIFQKGDGNVAGLTVSGSGSEHSITQNGDGNTTNLDVTGAGTSVSYTLNGSNYTTPGNAIQVFTTSGANVTITQTPMVTIGRN